MREAVNVAVFGLLVSVGLSVGFNSPGPWWAKPLLGVCAALLLGLLIRQRERLRLVKPMRELTRL